MSPTQFYREQADQQQAAADTATLQNVRERCQRAADAWDALASRSERADGVRKAAAIKAAGDPGDAPHHDLLDAG